MKILPLILVLSLASTSALALPSRNPTPILGEAVDSSQQHDTSVN